MRITKISLVGLFEIFNHEILLNLNERITIIHGPNGFGKTTILRMVNALFNGRYFQLSKVLFSELKVDFDNESYIHVRKVAKSRGKNDSTQLYISAPNCENPFTWSSVSQMEKERQKLLKNIDEFPFLSRIDYESWVHHPDGEIMSLDDILENFGDRLGFPENPTPEWLKTIQESIHVNFIETQRLLKFPSPGLYTESYRQRAYLTTRSTVSLLSKELAKEIQTNLGQYADLSQSLDRSFPARLVKATHSLSDQDLHRRLEQLEQKRKSLISVGLLEPQPDGLEIQPEINEKTQSVLSVYIEDTERKLQVFDNLAAKINALRTIINKRFQYKQMSVSKEEGFTFSTFDGNKLRSSDLSSGEQHELVLLYELLFKVKPNSLVLIDEPEISLHIAWQVEYLKDLREIIELSQFDVLMATHSPDIISDRWDLTVELKGPNHAAEH